MSLSDSTNQMRADSFVARAGLPYSTKEFAPVSDLGGADGLVSENDMEETTSAEEYAKGFAEGYSAALNEKNIEAAARERLAIALEQLQPADTHQLSVIFWQTLKNLLIECLGHAAPEESFFRDRCAAAIDQFEIAPERLTLNIATDDLVFLEEQDLPLEIVTDQDLARGSVVIKHEAAEFHSGSSAVLASIDNILSEISCDPC